MAHVPHDCCMPRLLENHGVRAARFLRSALAALFLAAVSFGQAAPPPTPLPQDMRAKSLVPKRIEISLAQETRGEEWDFSDGSREHFTWFSDALDGVTVENDRLRFTIEDGRGMIGWGNYRGKFPVTGDPVLWPGWNQIRMRVRQSAEGESHWRINLWQDGWEDTEEVKRPPVARARVGNMEPKGFQDLKGNEWTDLIFDVGLPEPDGFDLLIEGPPNNRIEIDKIEMLRVDYQGNFRLKFTVPDKPIWRSPVSVKEDVELWLNGHKLPWEFGCHDGGAVFYSFNIAPYLQPGENVLATFAKASPPPNAPGLIPKKQQPRGFTKVQVPTVLMQGRLIFEDGTFLELDTGPQWKSGPGEIESFSQTAFDDTGWDEPGMETTRVPYARYASNRSWGVPAWDGLLHYRNPAPDERSFFYAEDEPMRIDFLTPNGVTGRNPSVRWRLRGLNDTDEPLIASGEITEARRDGNSLIFELDAGARPRGVYTIEADLLLNGQLEEARVREPIVVTRRIPMPEAAGKSLRDDLDLTLEREIDFTDPNDPHRWVEAQVEKYPRDMITEPVEPITEATIIERDGLTYRRIRPGRGSHFSYEFEFERPGSWYLLEMDYPDDDVRLMSMAVTHAGFGGGMESIYEHNRTMSGPAVGTGGKHPLTGEMKTLQALHLADPGPQILSVVNLLRDQAAGAARVRMYRIRELPALRTGDLNERRIGLHTERSHTFAYNFWTGYPGLSEDKWKPLNLDAKQAQLQWLNRWLDACESYTRYLRFTGQNTHAMGMYQYDKHNTGSYARHPRVETPTIQRHIGEVLLRVFAKNDLTMMSLIEFARSNKLDAQYAVGDGAMARGAETVKPVSKNGNQARWMSNFNHPRVAEAYLRVIDDLGYAFGHVKAWDGVYVMGAPGFSGPVAHADWRSSEPMEYCYSDATVALFEQETGLSVPGEGPDRFSTRYEFLTAPENRERWVAWRVNRVRDLLLQTRAALREYRDDLGVLYGEYIYTSLATDWQEQDRPFNEHFREFGFDPGRYRDDDGIWIGRYLYPNACETVADRTSPLAWALHYSDQVTGTYNHPQRRLAVLRTGWHEIPILTPGVHGLRAARGETIPADWPLRWSRSRHISQPPGDYSREAYVCALIGSDVDSLLFGFTDAVVITGNEQQLREFNRAFRALPRERFAVAADTDGFAHNLVVRELVQDNRTWFYVANPGFYPISGEVRLNGRAAVVDPATGEPVPSRPTPDATVVPVALKPYGVAAFRADAAGIRVTGCASEPIPGEHVAYMQTILSDVEKRLAERHADLSADDVAFLNSTMASAREALAAGEYARAWLLATHWRFWALRLELGGGAIHLEKGAL